MRKSRMVAFDEINDDSSKSLVSRTLTRRMSGRTLARERESIKNEEGVGLSRFPLHADSPVAPSRRIVPAYTGLGYAESAPYLLLGGAPDVLLLAEEPVNGDPDEGVLRDPLAPRDALRRLTRRASNARESTWSLLRRASLRSSARYFGTRGAGVMASSRLSSLAAGSTVAPLPVPGLLSGTSSRSPVAVLLRSRPSLSLSCGAAPISSMRSARPRRRLPPIKRSPYRDHRAARQLPSCSHPRRCGSCAVRARL